MPADKDPRATVKRPVDLDEGTRLESDEEIRRVLQARQQRLAGGGKQTQHKPSAPAETEARTERPVQRPPMARLCILDDGKQDGEWLRLRTDRTVIGRTEGDVRIPHDGLMSSRHAEIVREKAPNGYRWVLTDLHSTNGTLVRVSNTLLRHENEVLVGTGRYRFESVAGAEQAAAVSLPPAEGGVTQPWPHDPVRAFIPSLVEWTSAGPVQRYSLTLPEYWIGSDVRICAIPRPDDVFVSARHARLYRDSKGRWHIENHESVNGLWLRVDQIALGKACQFRLGEQRFLFRVS